MQNYARDQAKLLEASRNLAKVLIEEHRSYHRELVNSNREDPRIYRKGDIVFARRATRSDKARGRVGKLMNAFTGPWRVISKLDGGSYKLQHCVHANKYDKKHAAHMSPYPEQLVPFEPMDGPDNRFSQLYKNIQKNPYEDAGIKGFEPIEPYKLSPTHFVGTHKDGINFPSLQELNDEFRPYPWSYEGEEEIVFRDNSVDSTTTMYHGPPPSPPRTAVQPNLPALSDLTVSLVTSKDRLFFISLAIEGTSRHEWHLVRVNLDSSMSQHKTCLQDGKFLVEFYKLHDSDTRCNGINQRYWLQYHRNDDFFTPSSLTETHQIRPSPTSELYATRKQLRPFSKWVNLTHSSTYIHGPFDFATVNGIKTRDRLSEADVDVLIQHKSMYDNEHPSKDLPTYSIHVDHSVHIVVHSPSAAALLLASHHV